MGGGREVRTNIYQPTPGTLPSRGKGPRGPCADTVAPGMGGAVVSAQVYDTMSGVCRHACPTGSNAPPERQQSICLTTPPSIQACVRPVSICSALRRGEGASSFCVCGRRPTRPFANTRPCPCSSVAATSRRPPRTLRTPGRPRHPVRRRARSGETWVFMLRDPRLLVEHLGEPGDTLGDLLF
jgi:hypothetical protein